MNEQERNRATWEKHYDRSISKLGYPDENLVRILSKIEPTSKKALDFGSGSGRHCKLLLDFGFSVLAADIADNSLALLKDIDSRIETVLISNSEMPFPKSFFGLIVAWGVLHYNQKEEAAKIVDQLYDSLESGGYLVGSIRAESDSHLALENGTIGLSDLKGGFAVTFSEKEIRSLLSKFSDLQIGYSERSPLGDISTRICHYFFLARK